MHILSISLIDHSTWRELSIYWMMPMKISHENGNWKKEKSNQSLLDRRRHENEVNVSIVLLLHGQTLTQSHYLRQWKCDQRVERNPVCGQ